MLAQKHIDDAPTPAGIAPRDADLALAIQHHVAGRLDDASAIYQRLHAAEPGNSEVIFLMGVLCCDLQLFEPATRFLDSALLLAPRFPEARAQLVIALNGLAEAASSDGKLTAARQHLERALGLAPADPCTLQALGRIALAAGDPAGAEMHLMASLAQRPEHAQTLNWLGLARLQLEKYPGAETCLRKALRLQPDLNQARNNLGLALYKQERLFEAKPCFVEALARDPGYAKARTNLGVTLRLLGRHAEARSELEAVLAAHPDEVDALNNLGVVFQDLGEPDLALAHLTRAQRLAPQLPTVRWNLSLTQLLLGDFANGWANYEARWEGCEHLRGGYGLPPEKAWHGERLDGKRLLLWAEQGFGDTLQFVRFARDAAQRGAVVTLLAQPELAALAGSAAGVSRVVVQGAALPPYDVHCPLLSLPHCLGVSANRADLHGDSPYLSAAPDRRQQWQERLAGPAGLKVGLVWAGSARRQSLELRAIDLRRSITLDRLAPLLAVPGCRFFSLQKGIAARELATLRAATGAGTSIEDHSGEWSDFSATAAVLANLDLVISVDTAVAHLAGALGKPVWLLNRHDSCWRWLRGRDDSPWYATLRQFRQPAPGEWEPVIAAAAAALAREALQQPA